MKKIFTLCMLALMPLLAMADDDQGTCGTNLTWTYTESTKTLTIEGTGAMDDYTMEAPWHTHEETIQKVEIGQGVTRIGQGAFILCTALSSVNIPNTVTSIGEGAFAACESLTSIDIPSSVTSIEDDVFMGTIYLATVNIYATTPPTIGSNVFLYILADTKIHVPKGTVDDYKTSWSDYADMIVGPSTAVDHVYANQPKNAYPTGAVKIVKNGRLIIETADGAQFDAAGANY